MYEYARILVVAGIVLFCVPAVQAFNMDWVTVGDPGNVGELSGAGAGGFGADRISGAVDHVYQIGKYEVTNAQYTEFLNTVDPNGSNQYALYDNYMGVSSYGGINFDSNGLTGSKYTVKSGRANHPVNYQSYWSACRFANWMHNGQGAGDTETGAYSLNGVVNPDNASITRNPGAKVFLPNEDEWYKAAYYKGGGNDAGYWDFATQSDIDPIAEFPSGGSNSVNFSMVVKDTTEVGAYSQAVSAYGTFDQMGNVWEWTETIDISDWFSGRDTRGGSFSYVDAYEMQASYRVWYPQGVEDSWSPSVGFRLAAVPEPGTIAFLMMGSMALLRRRRR